jgi:hypothetical protein
MACGRFKAIDEEREVDLRHCSREVVMRERIEVRSDIHFGEPCVAGMRIPVQSVLELVREGVTPLTMPRPLPQSLS